MKKVLIALALTIGCATTKPCLVTPPPTQSNYKSCMMLVVNGESGGSDHMMFVCEKTDMNNLFQDMSKSVNWSKHAWEKCGK